MSYHLAGMGALTQGQALQCAGSFWSYLTTPECWNYTGSQLESTLTAPTAAVTTSGPVAPAAGYTNTTDTSYMDLYASAQQGNDAGMTELQKANLAQAQAAYNAPAAPGSSNPSPSCAIGDIPCYLGSVPWWAWLAVGVGGFMLLRKAN